MYNKLMRLEEFLSPLFLLGMSVIIIFQVANRYMFTYAMDWPEELGRYLFLFAVYQGTSYAEMKGRHLEITLLRTLFKGRFDLPLRLVAKVGGLIFCGIMTVWGAQMVLFVADSGQLAPALQIPMFIVYLCVPVGMCSMFLHTVVNTMQIFKLFSANKAAA